MRFFIKATAALLLLAGFMQVALAEPGVKPEVSKAIIDKLSAARPELELGAVETTPVPGIYQVRVTRGPILYVTGDGKYFFVGDLYQVEPNEFVNLGERAMNELRRQELAKLKVEDMIVFPATGETRAVVNVFTDVDCGYCRKLHQEMAAYNQAGIEIRYLAFPRAGLESESYRRIASAWCAPDQDQRRQALTRLKRGESIEENVCAGNPVASQYELGNEMGVNGTPAMVLMDGTMLPGYRSAPALARILGIN